MLMAAKQTQSHSYCIHVWIRCCGLCGALCVRFAQSLIHHPPRRLPKDGTIATQYTPVGWWNIPSSDALTWWPVFKSHHLFSSCAAFISSCLGRILASELSFTLFVHKGATITPNDIQLQPQVYLFRTHGWFNNDPACTPFEQTRLLDFFLQGGLIVNLPMLIENYMQLCCSGFFSSSLHSSVDSNTKLLFFTQTPCIFFFSPRRWLRGLQSTPLRLPSALFGC